MDKSFWKAVMDSGYVLPDGYTISDLTPELTSYLGSPDPVLRDDIAYIVLIRWITRGEYQPDELRAMIGQMCINLQIGLGEQGTDNVFVRSFSALMLASILYYDNHHEQFLSETEVRSLLDTALDYLAHEHDLRGYVVEKGWAHSAAHTADWVDELALSRYLQPADLERILNAIGAKVMMPSGYIFHNDEDERLSVAAVTALKREMYTGAFLTAWIGNLAGLMQRTSRQNLMIDDAPHSAYVNTKNFLRALYVRLMLAKELPEPVQGWVPEILTALRAFGFAYD
ncbi:MAG TPA: DUF2785 domain-containing protein [Aggregatilineaceae bacterium]|nr:DUF2785 domain-containing protein [Aggregatilineaceae bacterium]